MGEYSTDVDAGTIIMDRGNEPVLIAANIEDRLVVHLVGAGERLAQPGAAGEPAGLYLPTPGFQGALRVGMLPRKFVEPLAGDDVHGERLHQTNLGTSRTLRHEGVRP